MISYCITLFTLLCVTAGNISAAQKFDASQLPSHKESLKEKNLQIKMQLLNEKNAKLIQEFEKIENFQDLCDCVTALKKIGYTESSFSGAATVKFRRKSEAILWDLLEKNDDSFFKKNAQQITDVITFTKGIVNCLKNQLIAKITPATSTSDANQELQDGSSASPSNGSERIKPEQPTPTPKPHDTETPEKQDKNLDDSLSGKTLAQYLFYPADWVGNAFSATNNQILLCRIAQGVFSTALVATIAAVAYKLITARKAHQKTSIC